MTSKTLTILLTRTSKSKLKWVAQTKPSTTFKTTVEITTLDFLRLVGFTPQNIVSCPQKNNMIPQDLQGQISDQIMRKKFLSQKSRSRPKVRWRVLLEAHWESHKKWSSRTYSKRKSARASVWKRVYLVVTSNRPFKLHSCNNTNRAQSLHLKNRQIDKISRIPNNYHQRQI